MIPLGSWVEPLIIPAGKFANTFAASVTSANASIPSNLSNISSDINPQLSVSAKLRATLSPSDELIENPVPLTVLVKLVETFVTFAVLVATSDAIEELNEVNEPDIIVGVNAFTNAIVANSESINAPAAATFVASVTSAIASIPSSLFFNVVVKSFAVWAGRDVSKEPSPTKEPVNEPVNGRVMYQTELNHLLFQQVIVL